MKKTLIVALSIISSLESSSQNKTFVKDNLFKINVLSPGFAYERGLTSKSTIYLEANLSFGYHSNDFTGDKLLFAPQFIVQYRQYYNFEKRLQKGKSITKNSGNYLAIHTENYFKPIGNDSYTNGWNGITVGGIWGFQKTYKHNFNLGADAGIGYYYRNESSKGVTPILNFSLGWVIGK